MAVIKKMAKGGGVVAGGGLGQRRFGTLCAGADASSVTPSPSRSMKRCMTTSIGIIYKELCNAKFGAANSDIAFTSSREFLEEMRRPFS